MKKIFIGILLIAGTMWLHAQDIIIKENGDEIKAKVMEIGITEIKYKKAGNEEGPTYAILKSEVFLIKYANGTKDVIPLEPEQPVTPQRQPATTQGQSVVTQTQPVAQSPMPAEQITPMPENQPEKEKEWKRNVFNWNIKYSFSLDSYDYTRDFLGSSNINMGFGYIHNFNPWFGWEFINVQFGHPLQFNTLNLNISFMTGPRVYLASLKRKVTPFIQVKSGYESGLLDWSVGMVPIEAEFGINFGRTFYLSFGWKHSFVVVPRNFNFNSGMLFGQIGFNF